MKAALRFSAILICLSLLFTACTEAAETPSGTVSDSSTNTQNTAQSGVKEFRLAYSSMDTLDPYSAKSKQNKELSTLLYDSLFAVDDSYKLIYRVGTGIETYEKYLVVTLKNDVYFTDGSLLTAKDVVDSYNAAKASNTAGYKDDLSNFKSCTQLSDTVVTFELKSALTNAQYALIFPIFKSGTRGQKLSTGIAKAPIGSGRYIYSNINGNATLVANNSWAFGTVKTPTLVLTETVDEQAVAFCLSNGKVNCGYDDLYDEALDTANGSKTLPVPLNNIVFLGANSKSKYFGNKDFRRFLSYLIDRERICADSYLSRALPATGIFNPQYQEMAAKMELPVTAVAAKAQEVFETLDFDEQKDAEGFYTKDGVRVNLRLAVSKAATFRVQTANYIAAALSTFGIACTVSVYTPEEYTAALKNGNYDFYVGEMKVGNDLSLSSLLTVYGAPNGDALASYKKYRAGSITATEFIDVFEEELPIIPLCFRLGSVFLPKNMQGDMNSSYSDVYFNIQNCYFS